MLHTTNQKKCLTVPSITSVFDDGYPVSLAAMLNRRETRVKQQEAWCHLYRSALLSFTLNIPGPIKTSTMLRRVFQEGCRIIHENLCALDSLVIVADETLPLATGDEYLCAFHGDPSLIKKRMMSIEEHHPLGRLFDIDILLPSGEKLSRPRYRRCLLCDEQAQACARSRAHTLDELQTAISHLIMANYYPGLK
ncbi:citrate lyase holo-[acyl-carrier protein] synthase [Veillonella magna]|uniref:citrate lyase holo-[acyl-carrier protein] synthase n=1 Tax=Veillonella magna TaxID=464322 RepID=UPI002665C856|nr:citrate lyase holo-[acyl-carrier protein] synthase [Veillonella magna]